MTRKIIEFPKESIKELSKVASHVYEVAKISGFHEDNENVNESGRFGDYCANLHGEVSELWEAYRKGNLYKQCDKPVELSCAAEELADIVIRAMDTAVALGVDIGEAIAAKDSYNQTREFKHGGKKA